MWPLLQVLTDQQERSIAECRQLLASHFSLTAEESALMLPSGRTPVFNSRVHWAKTYLEKAGVLQATARGWVKITERGLALAAEPREALSSKDLDRYPEFQQWREASRNVSRSREQSDGAEPLEAVDLPPDESLDLSFRRYRLAVQSDVLERIKSMPPPFFERLIIDLLLKLGYGGPFGSGLQLGRTGDHGVDGIIYQDKLGLDLLYFQAKRWDGSVGSSVVREFAGALSAHRARKGLVITTGTFTRDALQDAERMGERIVLIDGSRLSELLYETGLGLVTDATFEMKRIDSDYFEGE